MPKLRQGMVCTGMLALLLALTGGRERPAPLSPAELRRLPAADDGLRLLTNQATLSTSWISPPRCVDCSGDGVQDQVTVSFLVVATDTIRAAVYIDTAGDPANTLFRGDIDPLKDRAPGFRYFKEFRGIVVGELSTVVLPDGFYNIIIRAHDDTNRVEADTLALEIDRIPPRLTSLEFRDGRTRYRNGETVVLEALLDRPDYRVLPDFSALDSDTAGGTTLLDLGDGRYEIRHTISMANTRPDAAELLVPVGFVDRAGNRVNYNVLRACLSNRPPRLVSLRALNNADGAYRSGDRIEIESTWDSSDTLLTVVADFAPLDSHFDSSAVTTARSTGNRYVTSYPLSSANELTDGTYRLPVQAFDRGCGASDVALIDIVLDNEPGTRPTINALPASVRTSAIRISGTAPGSVRVDIRRNNTLADTAHVNAAGEFARNIVLTAGTNNLVVEGFDAAGNKTTPSTTSTVFLVTEMFITVPAPFRAGNSFQVGTDRSAQGLRIELWTLGGDLAAVLEDGTSRDLYTIPWNGTDDSGAPVNAGPLIGIFQVTYNDGDVRTERRALVLAPR